MISQSKITRFTKKVNFNRYHRTKTYVDSVIKHFSIKSEYPVKSVHFNQVFRILLYCKL
jgi:hypothetical protein